MKLTYFFLDGRKERLKSDTNCPKEMFTSYDYFFDKFIYKEIIQFTDNRKGSIAQFLKFLDRVLNKVTKLPFFTYNALTSKISKLFQNQIILSWPKTG